MIPSGEIRIKSTNDVQWEWIHIRLAWNRERSESPITVVDIDHDTVTRKSSPQAWTLSKWVAKKLNRPQVGGIDLAFILVENGVQVTPMEGEGLHCQDHGKISKPACEWINIPNVIEFLPISVDQLKKMFKKIHSEPKKRPSLVPNIMPKFDANLQVLPGEIALQWAGDAAAGAFLRARLSGGEVRCRVVNWLQTMTA